MTMPPDSPTIESKPLLSLELEASAFASDWKHCDQAANYLARMASFDRADTFLHSNLLSTVLNEVFEIIFFRHQPKGNLQFRVLRGADGRDRLEFGIPVGSDERDFYEEAIARAQSPNVRELYSRSLLHDDCPDRAVGFLELAADYDAKMRLESDSTESTLRVVMDVCLENLTNKNQPS